MGLFDEFTEHQLSEEEKKKIQKIVKEPTIEVGSEVLPEEEVGELAFEGTIIDESKLVSKIESFGFTDLQKLKSERGLRILVYGAPGSGKTHFCLTAPDPIVFIDTEYSVEFLASLAKNKTVKVFTIFEYDEKTFEMNSLAMIKQFEKSLSLLPKVMDNTKTIAIDSGTSIWQYLQDWLRYELIRIGGRLNLKGVPADRRDWCRAYSKYYGFMANLLSKRANIILTAQSHPVYDDAGNILPEAKPSMQKNTPFWFNVILELSTREVNGTTKHFGKIVKCRYPTNKSLVGLEIEDPSFDKIKNLIEQNLIT